MIHPTDDLRIETLRPLVSPAILMEDLPITEPISATVAQGRDSVSRIMRGEEDFVLTEEGCFVSKKCENNECRGEDILSVNVINNVLKDLGI